MDTDIVRWEDTDNNRSCWRHKLCWGLDQRNGGVLLGWSMLKAKENNTVTSEESIFACIGCDQDCHSCVGLFLSFWLQTQGLFRLMDATYPLLLWWLASNLLYKQLWMPLLAILGGSDVNFLSKLYEWLEPFTWFFFVLSQLYGRTEPFSWSALSPLKDNWKPLFICFATACKCSLI